MKECYDCAEDRIPGGGIFCEQCLDHDKRDWKPKIRLNKPEPPPAPPPPRYIKDGQEICELKQPHYHIDERGFMVKCYHNGKALLLNWQFWAGLTLGFPLEHLIWEKLWPFSVITKLLGL